MRAILHLGVMVSLSTLLAGCPFPVPIGYNSDSRENVDEVVPRFVKLGRTTREDVLLKMGEPDAIAVDESWMAYGSGYSLGGMGVVVAAGSSGVGAVATWRQRYRRLLFRFDQHGIIIISIIESRECGETGLAFGKAGGKSKPCLDIWGDDIAEKYHVSGKRN